MIHLKKGEMDDIIQKVKDLPDETTFPRIQKLLENYWTFKPALDIERALIYTESYKESEGEDILVRRGKAYKKYCEERELLMYDDELFCGRASLVPRGAPVAPEFHIGFLEEELEELSTRERDPYRVTPEQIATLREVVFPYWKGKTVSEFWLKQIRPDTKEMIFKTGIIDGDSKTQSPPGEIAPHWEMVLNRGLGGILEEARERLNTLDEADANDWPKANFYKSSILCFEGLQIYARRYAELAWEKAKAEKDQIRKKELLQIQDNLNWICEKPARTFWEALQLVWLLQVGCQMEGNAPSYSPGRVDQYLLKYYENDLEEGTLTVDRALELIEAFYLMFGECTWFVSKNAAQYFAGYQPFLNLCVGGITPEGFDATNPLSYLFVTAKMHIRLHSPSLSIRVHKQSPQEFLMHVARLSRLGTGFPAIHCDEPAIRMMLKDGATLEEAYNYQLVGCVEPFVPGKVAKWTNGGHYNFASAVEFALTNGRSILNENKLYGIETGDPRKMAFEEFKQATKDQLANMIRHISIACQVCERLHAELTPIPFASTLVEGCYEHGKDITRGGAKYNVGPAFLGTGITDVANSLAAIKKFVYDDKSVSMDTMIDAIYKNFEGYDELLAMVRTKTPFFGNDIEETDEFAAEFADFAHDQIVSYKSWRGPSFASALYPVTSHLPHGRAVAALPYGRLAGEPLADGCSPNHGTDRNGPTAVLKSVSKINHEKHTAGTLLNMRLDPVSVKGEEGLKRITDIIRTMADLSIYHIQFNVITTETLKAAQKNPEKYRGLLVRVAGYSAYFGELCKEMQNDIIERTVHTA